MHRPPVVPRPAHPAARYCSPPGGFGFQPGQVPDDPELHADLSRPAAQAKLVSNEFGCPPAWVFALYCAHEWRGLGQEGPLNSYNGFPPAQRSRALAWLKREYAAGRRVRPTICDACGQTEGLVEAHSEDYSEPFGDQTGAYGFCLTCHMMLHCRARAPEAWLTYKAAIAAGVTFEPFYTRNFPRVLVLYVHRSATPRLTRREPPQRLVLDEIEASQDAHRGHAPPLPTGRVGGLQGGLQKG